MHSKQKKGSYPIVNNRHMPARQEGAVLVVSLIILSLIMMLTVTSMQREGMQQKMSTNQVSKSIAFQMAESALAQGEQVLKGSIDVLTLSKANTAQLAGVSCVIDKNLNTDFKDPAVWNNGGACQFTGATNPSAAVPQYFIEFFYADPLLDLSEQNRLRTCFYRVTARGVGGQPASIALLQSTYRFSNCS